MADIDNLSIKISVSATKALNALDRLTNGLVRMQSAINTSQFDQLADSMTRVSQAAANLSKQTTDMRKFANALSRLDRIDTSKQSQIASSINKMSTELAGATGLSQVSKDIDLLARGISRLGYKSVDKAIANMPLLGQSMVNLMQSLARAPTVSANLIQMTNALARLTNQGSKVGSASKSVNKGIESIHNTSLKSKAGVFSLARSFGTLYANFFLAIRGAKSLVRAIKSAMDYVENLNYFDKALEQVVSHADLRQWSKLGYDSANAYAESFRKRMTEVTSELTGFNLGSDGTLKESSGASLGIDPSQVIQYQAVFGQMSSSMGTTSDDAVLLSEVMTKLGADLASVKNLDFGETWTSLQSGLAGMSRTVDKFGMNIRNVNLQAELTRLGINANITALNQNEKALLRSIVMVNSAEYAWGDLAETLGQPANQLRLLQSNFANLGRSIGNIFLPTVSAILPYLNGLVIALKRVADSIAAFFGFEGLGGSDAPIVSDALSTIYDDADEVADNLGSATKAAKELKNELMGFDEINKLSEVTDTSSGKGSGLGTDDMTKLNDAFRDASTRYLKEWNKAYRQVQNKAKEIADSITGSFGDIRTAIEPTIKSFEALVTALEPVGGFAWGTLKDFYNDFLVPISSWTFSEAIPQLLDIITDFISSINWESIRTYIDKIYKLLAQFITWIGDRILEFISYLYPQMKPLLDDLWEIFKDIVDVLEILWPVISQKLIPAFQMLQINFSLQITIARLVVNAFVTILDILRTLATFVAQVLCGDWIGAMNTLTDGARDVEKDVVKHFSAIKDFFSNSFSGPVKRIFSSLSDSISGSLSKITGSISSVTSKVSGVFHTGISLPKFATGGFPEDGLFMANHNELVGKFSNGKTAVANNGQIIQGITNGVAEGTARALAAYGNNGGNVTIKIEGDPYGMFKVMQEQANNYTDITGLSPFPV